MADLLAIGGIILVFLILISPIIAIILEEIYSRKKDLKENQEKDL